MFNEVITSNKVPPNFINSILTNPSLYEMFKNEYDENIEYFQNISKEEYLTLMLKFIEDTLFSSNIFHIYSDNVDIEEFTRGKLDFIKRFYDDFLLEEIKNAPENILNTKFFKGLEYVKNNDLYAGNTEEFKKLYSYVFNESIDYFGIVDVLLSEPLKTLRSGKELPLKDFDCLKNYVKNNINGRIDMDIVTNMLHNHAYKTNHIFDAELAMELVSSTVKSYGEYYNIDLNVVFSQDRDEEEKKDDYTVYIDYKYIEDFISLNYVELYQRVFYEANKTINKILIKLNRNDYFTLRCIMNLVVNKVDVARIFDADYRAVEYEADLEASSFISTLKFFASFGVNLIDSYIEAKCRELNISNEEGTIISEKEISLDQRFYKMFDANPKKDELIRTYPCLGIIYNKDGSRLKLIDLVKKIPKSDNKEAIMEYLHSRIIDPISMIDDVNDFANFNTKSEEIKEIVETELKYIYVDTFYYSLNSYISLQKSSKFDVLEFLDDLVVKVNCLKDTPLTHKFIDECLFTILDMRGNF